MGLPAVLILLSLTHAALAATAPPLGAAGNFAVLGATAVTNAGASVITGDMGNSPGVTFTGFPPGIVTGIIRANDALAIQAQTDATTAYNNLAAQACITTVAADLGGQTLAPGVYCSGSTMGLTGTVTLDAGGVSNAVWVFQMGSTLTTASNSVVQVINGGQQNNVFWQVGSSATLGTTSKFAGHILALTSITVNTGATVSGRVLALTGAVTLDTNTVSLFPILAFVKSVAAYFDPVNGLTNPKAIPGTEMLYTITATNSGYGAVDNNTTVVTDTVPANMSMCVSTLCSNPPVVFTCSAVSACGLTYVYATDVTYSSQAGGGAPFNYLAVADAAGYDANVTGVRINPTGIFSGLSGGGNPSFSLLLKMRIK